MVKDILNFEEEESNEINNRNFSLYFDFRLPINKMILLNLFVFIKSFGQHKLCGISAPTVQSDFMK